MKKLILVIFGAIMASTSFAQFNQGGFIVGGSSNLSSSFTTSKLKTGSTTSTLGKFSSFSIEPQAAYFVIDNLAVGTGLQISTSSYKPDGSSDKSTSLGFGLTPQARYYFDNIYVQGSIRVGSNKTKNTNNGTTTESTVNLGGWSLLGGYSYFISDAISFEPQLGYAHNTQKSKGSNTKQINSGIVIGIGLYAYINR
ncbi:MAG TPA: outer membrane beta-barrel protein [Cyclobacteriaceae bacterium]|nr:autotransporter outer membrane beta-barrel domain-containing protein [Cyclobacteriaceae bacterium]HNP08026.1 outer membrane beta-barrel protein [Cyclobacteriaceae bacterium]HRK55504.1 outer membrane beta-barrel protein [Cyclobacteriaceae bacterium]